MKCFLTLIALVGFQCAMGQSFDKITVFSLKIKNNKFIRITVQNVLSLKMEGYDGKNIVLESSTVITAPAANLKDISPAVPDKKAARAPKSPYTKESADSFSIFFQGDRSKVYVLKLPKNVHVSITQLNGDSLVVENYEGEIETRTDASFININHITGPLILNARSLSSGSKQIVISDLLRGAGSRTCGAVNILSVNHDIDISVEKQWPLTFEIFAQHGDIYSNLDMKILPAKTEMNNRISGRLNGGGSLFQIRSEYGNVYLRQRGSALRNY